MIAQDKLARAWWALLHNCIAHPLLFWTGNAKWVVRFHDWTAQEWQGALPAPAAEPLRAITGEKRAAHA